MTILKLQTSRWYYMKNEVLVIVFPSIFSKNKVSSLIGKYQKSSQNTKPKIS